jgi:hypothetical protein
MRLFSFRSPVGAEDSRLCTHRAMTLDDLIAAVDEWGRRRQHNGYRSRAAHRHPTDMAAGSLSLSVEHQDDEARLAWVVPLLERADAGNLHKADLHDLVMRIDRWGFARWLHGWSGSVASEPSGADREAWVASLRRAWLLGEPGGDARPGGAVQAFAVAVVAVGGARVGVPHGLLHVVAGDTGVA